MAKPQFDVTQHRLVPIHTKLTSKEKQEILDQFHISANELLKIYASDPAIHHLNPKSGDIIKIIRKSPTTGTTTVYRVVIDA